jgi:hypothetical protein
MNSYWKPARPAPSWNPWGQLPPPQRGGGGEEDSCASNNVLNVSAYFANFNPPMPLVISKKLICSTKVCNSYV